MVYARQDAQGRELRLGVSGMLWRDGLVMFDRDTHTLWAQVSGEALVGPRAGQMLSPIPSVRTTWREWVRAHPGTRVLSKEGRQVRSSHYAAYHRDPSQLGVLGTRNPDARLPGKALVVGVAEGEDGTAVRRAVLVKRGLVASALGERPIVFVWRGEAGGPAVFGTAVDGRALTLRQEGSDLRDAETGSRWSSATGEALEGPLRGKRLLPYPSLEAYWFAWAAYHPRSRIAR